MQVMRTVTKFKEILGSRPTPRATYALNSHWIKYKCSLRAQGLVLMTLLLPVMPLPPYPLGCSIRLHLSDPRDLSETLPPLARFEWKWQTAAFCVRLVAVWVVRHAHRAPHVSSAQGAWGLSIRWKQYVPARHYMPHPSKSTDPLQGWKFVYEAIPELV